MSYTLLRTGLIAKPRLCIRGHRYIDFDFAQELAIGVEHLDAAISTIRNIDVALGVGRDTVRCVEQTWSRILSSLWCRLAP